MAERIQTDNTNSEQGRLYVKPGSPAAEAAKKMKALIELKQAETYHEAHQILMGRDKTHKPGGGKPLTEEERTRQKESPERYVMARRFIIDHIE